LLIVAVGKVKPPGLRTLADEYLRRIRRHVRCDEIEVRDDASLPKAIPPSAWVVALEVRGRTLSSPQLAEHVEQWGSTGKGEVAFLIGGAEGLPPGLSEAAHVRVSLSALTLPHRLARIILLEQLYRAMSILRGEPYARED
jgi:23S rRNA (pseudouridine1915-N3)-methyltransferase